MKLNNKIDSKILLHQDGLGGACTVYNSTTNEVIYKTGKGANIIHKLYMSDDSVAIAFMEKSDDIKVRKNRTDLVFIQNGVLRKVVKSVKWPRRCTLGSDDLFSVGLVDEDVCYIIGFDKVTNKFKLVDTFDLFINTLENENSFVVTGNKLYLYNKPTRTLKVIRDFSDKSFVINPLVSHNPVYRGDNHAIAMSSNTGIYNVDIPVVLVTCDGVSELINSDGIVIDRSIKRTLKLSNCMLVNNPSNYMGYVKTDGTCWMYDVSTNYSVKLDVIEEDILGKNILNSICLSDKTLVQMGIYMVAQEHKISNPYRKYGYLIDCSYIDLEEYKSSFDNNPIIFLPSGNGVTINYLNGDKLITLSDNFGNATIFNGIYMTPDHDGFFAIEMSCDLDTAIDNHFKSNLDSCLSTFSKCTKIYSENGKFEMDELKLDKFRRIIADKVNETKNFIISDIKDNK